MDVITRNTALWAMSVHRPLLVLSESGAISGSVILEFDSMVFQKRVTFPSEEAS